MSLVDLVGHVRGHMTIEMIIRVQGNTIWQCKVFEVATLWLPAAPPSISIEVLVVLTKP